jgi:D-psicose/D-tagatose/L-ribulose 3-epimerase
MIKYGLQMYMLTDSFGEDKLDLIKKAGDLGFDGVEISFGDPVAFPTAAVKKALADYDMEINFAIGLGPDTNSISPDAKVRKAGVAILKKAVDAAYAVTGGGCVIGGPNFAAWLYMTGKSPSADEWKWGVENYRQVCEYAASKNISLAVEVLNRFETHFINTLADAYRFCSDVGFDNALVQPDTYHMNQEEKSWGDSIRAAGDRIKYMHVIDSDRGIIGTGLVDWKEVFTALKDIHFDGWLTVEGFTRDSEIVAGLTKIWRDPAASAEKLASESLQALRSYEKKYFNK